MCSRPFARSLLLASIHVLLNLSFAHAQNFGVFRQLWTGLSTNDPSLNLLTNSALNPRWPGSPNPAYTKVFTNLETEANLMNGYGQRLRGFVVPPTNGSYTCWIASADASSLFLSADETPDQSVLICNVAAGTSPREWTKEPNQVSDPIPLEGGRRYYLEAIHRAAAGSDHLAVRWQLPNGTIEEPIAALSGGVPRLIPCRGTNTLPVFYVKPARLTVLDGRSATFSVLVTNQAPMAYQWLQNGAPVPGATESVFTLAAVNPALNTNTFRCVASNVVGVVTSSVATLTVRPDTTPPTLALALNIGLTNLYVGFSEPVELLSAANPTNYGLSGGIGVLGAAMNDPQSVLLWVSPLAWGTNYTVTVNNVRDLAGNPIGGGLAGLPPASLWLDSAARALRRLAQKSRAFAVDRPARRRAAGSPLLQPPPWPVGAAGDGHSLVLARPSYGEADPRAWALSNIVGGSPGALDGYRASPLRDVVINEIFAHASPGLTPYVELYNHSPAPVDLAGCVLTDAALSNKCVLPPGTVIPAQGFAVFYSPDLTFTLNPAGATLYFKNPDGSRILDAVTYEAQAPDVSAGRWPDGAAEWYPMKARTPGDHNGDILIGDIVINELMYKPISGNDDDQFLELYNQGATSVDLGGWNFTAGLKFTFPAHTVIAPDSYLVVARNLANLFAHYPNLSAANTVGNYTGKLPHGGGRVALARPVTYAQTNTLYVVEDELSFATGGRWGAWAHGGGSSLELVNPKTNHRLAPNWADSDETAKAAWTNLQVTGTLDHGANYGGSVDLVQLGLLGAGECLVDNVQVFQGTNTQNLIPNSTFESGLSGWTPRAVTAAPAWKPAAATSAPNACASAPATSSGPATIQSREI